MSRMSEAPRSLARLLRPELRLPPPLLLTALGSSTRSGLEASDFFLLAPAALVTLPFGSWDLDLKV